MSDRFRQHIASLYGTTEHSDVVLRFFKEREPDAEPPAKKLRGGAALPSDDNGLVFFGDPFPAHSLVLLGGCERFRAEIERWKHDDGATKCDHSLDSCRGSCCSKLHLRVPLHSEEEVGATLEALRFVYTGRLHVASFRDLMTVRRQADYLQVDGCAQACDAAMLARFSSPHDHHHHIHHHHPFHHHMALIAASPLASVVELYECRELLASETEPHVANLLTACRQHLVRHWDAPVPPPCAGLTAPLTAPPSTAIIPKPEPGSSPRRSPTQTLHPPHSQPQHHPTKAQLLVWLLGDALQVANSHERQAAFCALSASAVEALLACEDFGTDDEATVVVILRRWLDVRPASSEIRGRLARLVRLPHLGPAYLTFLAAELGWLGLSAEEALFAVRYAAAGPDERAFLAGLGRYDCGGTRYAGPRRQALPPAGLAFEWRLSGEEVATLERARVRGVEEARFAAFRGAIPLAVTARGFLWRVALHHPAGGGGRVHVRLVCRTDWKEAAAGVAYGSARLVVHRWSRGVRAEEEAFCAEEGCQPVWFGGDRMQGEGVLELRAGGGHAAGGGGGGSGGGSGEGGCGVGATRTVTADPLAAWAEYLHNGCITGSLTFFPPGQGCKGQ